MKDRMNKQCTAKQNSYEYVAGAAKTSVNERMQKIRFIIINGFVVNFWTTVKRLTKTMVS